jgi:glycosyltransferase involved in cell wall biosynthesis
LLQSFNPSAASALRRVVDRFRPDVIHVCIFLTQLSPSILPVLAGTPSLFHAVWYRAVCPLGTKMWPDGTRCHVSWGKECLRRRCVPLWDWIPLMGQMRTWHRRRGAFRAVVANSDATREILREGGIETTEVIRPGIARQPLARPLSERPTVVFAGRLVREKGADVLLRAFVAVAREIPSARLVLAGDGPERSELERAIRDLGLTERVTLAGALSFEAVQESFRGAWVQAVPSRWPEPFGMVAAEAMMRGTAVVASDSGGLREIVREGGTGFLVPPGDDEALAPALLRLLRDPGLADRMGREGRETASTRFGIDAHVDRFLALYERLGSGAGVA